MARMAAPMEVAARLTGCTLGCLRSGRRGIESNRIIVENMIATRRDWLRLTLLAGGLAPGTGWLSSAKADLPIVANWRTGVAIYGFDPVAYFVDGRPSEGSRDLEETFAGAIWR